MTPTLQESHVRPTKPSLEILECIRFQKFRYSTEKRPGKKFSEKKFMTIRVNNLEEKVIRVIILCTDAEDHEIFHPNCLVGTDCHDGLYDKEYPVDQNNFEITIPYLRTERIKINGEKSEQKTPYQANNIQAELSQRAEHLPSPYKENCLRQCQDQSGPSKKFDTNKVCLRVIVTVQTLVKRQNIYYQADSHIVFNRSEKTSLSIHKLSETSISAQHGALVDIFTNEEGPFIECDKCFIYVTVPGTSGGDWQSDTFSPKKEDILYKRVISYRIPPVAAIYDISSPTTAFLHLEIPQSSLYCNTEFIYNPLESNTDYDCIDDTVPKSNKRSFDGDSSDVEPVLKKLRHKLQGKHVHFGSEDPKTRGGSNVYHVDANEKGCNSTYRVLQNSVVVDAPQMQMICNSVGSIQGTQVDLGNQRNQQVVFSQQAILKEAVKPSQSQPARMPALGEKLMNNSAPLSKSHCSYAKAKPYSACAQNTYNTSSLNPVDKTKGFVPNFCRMQDLCPWEVRGPENDQVSFSTTQNSDVMTRPCENLPRHQSTYAMAMPLPNFPQNTSNTRSRNCDFLIPRKSLQVPSPWEVGSLSDDETFKFDQLSEDQSPTLPKKRFVIFPRTNDTKLSSNTDGASKQQGTLLQSGKSNVEATASAPLHGEPKKDDHDSTSAGVLSEACLERAVTDINLPTLEVSQIADNFNGGLNSLLS